MTVPASFAASRYYQRWAGAAPERAVRLDEMAALRLDRLDLDAALARELTAVPLSRAMRRLRNLLVCALLRRDLAGDADLDEVVTAMTAFADFAIRIQLDAAMAELVANHGAPIGADSGLPQQMMVLAMGKQGGGELNVSSDIDLIFVYPEDGDTAADAALGQRPLSNHEFFIRLGKKLIAALSEITEDGFTFRVDMALRPNGASGPLAASLAMVEQYLIVQGREWERYAWVKARAVTGTPEDIAALDAIVRPFVFRRYLDFGVIDAIRKMHAQIRAEVNRQERLHPDRSNNVKLGRGGIREIEFLAQVFQLIRGGRDATLRQRPTRATLGVLAEKNLLAPEIVARLLDSYDFLRRLEHRLQYLDDAQTHTLPPGELDRATVAAWMGLADTESLLAALDAHRQFVAGQFDAIFSDKADKDDDAIDPDSADGGADQLEATTARLASLGFDDPAGAARRIAATWQAPRLQALPEASRNRLVALVNAALPLVAACERQASGGYQLATLGRLLDFLETVARRAAYLSLLTEFPHTLERVIRMMHASDWAAKFLTQHPILLDELLDDRLRTALPDPPALAAELQLQLGEADGDTERQMDILRELQHAQLFHLLAQDLAGELTVERLADHLSALADCIVAAAIPAVWKTIAARHREVPRFAVIAYGKLGGKELGYVSDLDVIFLFDDDDQEAPALYAKLAQRFITWMTSHTAAGTLFDIDIALRPDGASGMLVSSVQAFERYQDNSAWSWEHQALTRARFCAGDAAIGERFEQIRDKVLRRERPAGGPLKRDVLDMRKRMLDAHPNRTPLFDLKQDPGGMIDLEFIVQYLVLQHAARFPRLTVNTGNIALLKLCAELGLITPAMADGAGDAYRLLRKLQHQLRLQGQEHGRVVPELVAERTAVIRQLWQTIFDESI
jgi:glutamate-ammonia-ligase adenylyltransferase